MSLEIRSNLEAIQRIPHRQYDRAQTIIFAGKREQGKTWGIKAYIETREPRVLALDPFNDFDGLAVANSPEWALAAMSQMGPTRRRIIPPIGDDSRDFAERFFSDVIDGEFPLRNALLLLDEITLWSTSHANKALETLVLQGRRLGIRMVIGCQRISLIPGVLLSEATELVLFKMTRPRDLDVAEDWSNIETAETVKKLVPTKCVLVEL